MSKSKDNFDSRKRWSLKMQERFAVPIYQEYWNIGKGDIIEVDAAADTEDVALEFDLSGVDKMVRPDTGVRYVAQRFRALRTDRTGGVKKPDFSQRTSTGAGEKTEYDKMMNAYRNGGNVPKIYAFGIGAAERKETCERLGFTEYHFIDYPGFLRLVDHGHLEAIARCKSPGGAEALYWRLEDMKRAGVVTDTISGTVLSSVWEQDQTDPDFPTAPGIKSTGQVSLMDFGGGD